MQSLKTIRKRISSIKNTMKITNAMRVISATKIRKSQEMVLSSREYTDRIKELALQVSSKEGDVVHPAFVLRPKIKRAILLVIMTDRGFCGALNDNMLKQIKPLLHYMEDRNIKTTVWVGGEKGKSVFEKHGIPAKQLNIVVGKDPDQEAVRDVCLRLLEKYYAGEIDQVVIAYNKFVSIVSQQINVDMFLPIWVKNKESFSPDNMVDFIYEPNKETVVDKLILDTLRSVSIQAVYEARTSELAARMVSMGQATDNAQDMVDELSGKYNRQRQASITRDLLDIITGAESIKR